MARTAHPIRKTPEQSIPVAGDKPAVQFIKRQQVESITSFSCTEIYRRIAAGTFPKQITLGPKCVVWIESEIYDWMNDRIAESLAVA